MSVSSPAARRSDGCAWGVGEAWGRHGGRVSVWRRGTGARQWFCLHHAILRTAYAHATTLTHPRSGGSKNRWRRCVGEEG
eukprot:1304271-Pyramimonas_sp.AAC.1